MLLVYLNTITYISILKREFHTESDYKKQDYKKLYAASNFLLSFVITAECNSLLSYNFLLTNQNSLQNDEVTICVYDITVYYLGNY